jgi:guanylate kinase
VSHDSFNQLLREGAFIEHAEFSSNLYGTSFQTVREIEQSGRRCILDIEAQVNITMSSLFLEQKISLSQSKGVRQIKCTNLNPVYLFISPPSMAALRARLQDRGTETEVSVQKRLATAVKEIQFAKELQVHDIVIVNDDLDRAYNLFKKVALGEKLTGDVLPLLDD